jgi:hypothetical protein
MRRLGGSLVSLGLLVAAMLTMGCPSEPQLRPPKQPENFTPPPDDDPRFSSPVKYPDKLLNQDTLIGPKDNGGGPGGQGNPGGLNPRMGAPGAGGPH